MASDTSVFHVGSTVVCGKEGAADTKLTILLKCWATVVLCLWCYCARLPPFHSCEAGVQPRSLACSSEPNLNMNRMLVQLFPLCRRKPSSCVTPVREQYMPSCVFELVGMLSPDMSG